MLAGRKAGDRAQMIGLAEALGWPFEVKELRHNALVYLPNILLGASLLSLDRRASNLFGPPWPDLILASGRRSVPAGRWVQARSDGRTRLVHIGRPWAPLRLFDLIITTPQYGLPSRPNVLQNTASLHRVDARHLADAATYWQSRFVHLPKPHIALLVGGTSRPYVINADIARALGRQASALAEKLGGSLLVSTSQRTPPEAAQALYDAITCPAHRYDWRDGGENPYSGYLAVAAAIIVTGDSASMLSEAQATGKPVHIFDLPERPDWRLRASRRLRRLAYRERGRRNRQHRILPRLYEKLVDLGLLTSTRDLKRLHEAFIARGWATRLGQPMPERTADSSEDWDHTLRRIRGMFQAVDEAANAGHAAASGSARSSSSNASWRR